MARRKRQSAGQDIMDAVSLLPWWGDVALALASYVFFHWLAGRPQPVLADPRQVAGVLPHGLIAGFSGWVQFVAPILCLMGAAISFFRRKKRDALVADTTASGSAGALNGISWEEFEILTAEALRLQGFELLEQGGAQPDGGLDVVARKGNETYLVQCKQWRAFKVDVKVVREWYGVMAAQGAAGGFVVTSGRFTEDAVAFAAGRNVRLIDGPQLFGMLQQSIAALSENREAQVPSASAPPTSAPV